MEEKTEQPTPKKIRDARKKGQVAQSKEVVSTALIAMLLLYFWAMSDEYVEAIMVIIAAPAQFYLLPFDQAFEAILNVIGEKMIELLLPLVLLLLVVGVFSNMMQFGVLFVGEPIKPELKKINPVEGFKKIFSIKNLVEFLKSIIKILLLSFLIYGVIMEALEDITEVSACGRECILPLVGSLFKSITLYTIAAFSIIAVADFIFQKSQHIKQLKMTKDEIKREYKQSEGDPEIKGKRKQIQQEMLQSDTPAQVKKSSVVITNPTHVAIGIYYSPDMESLPIITLKGQDLLAKHIKELAYKEGIPIMENVPLARALLADGEIECAIPSELIEPVAEVLKWVESLDAENNQ